MYQYLATYCPIGNTSSIESRYLIYREHLGWLFNKGRCKKLFEAENSRCLGPIQSSCSNPMVGRIPNGAPVLFSQHLEPNPATLFAEKRLENLFGFLSPTDTGKLSARSSTVQLSLASQLEIPRRVFLALLRLNRWSRNFYSGTPRSTRRSPPF